MILEHALLPVSPHRTAEFEAAFAEARALIAATPGFRSLTLSRSIESPGTYLLLVQWDRVEDHTEGFRGTPRYERWRQLLHHFYEPFPVVEHFTPVLDATPPNTGSATPPNTTDAHPRTGHATPPNTTNAHPRPRHPTPPG